MTALTLTQRVAIVTGAAHGLGKAEALSLARAGADLVLTDISDISATIAEVSELGVRAEAVLGDISDWALADTLVETALSTFGRLDIVVNNAGITRDAMIFNMSEEHWDSVMNTHAKGHASLIRAATAHWRTLSKSTGAPTYGRIINTASEAALTGSPGQPNYSAAKAGIIALTTATARSVEKYGVTVNAICPRARTSMTADVFTDSEELTDRDPLHPDHVARLVTLLASEEASSVTGKTFIVYGKMVALVSEPSIEATVTAAGEVLTEQELISELLPASSGSLNKNISGELAHLSHLAGLTSES